MTKLRFQQFRRLFALGLLSCAASLASSQQIPLTTLTLNGDAQIADGKYLLLTNSTSEAGSAFIPTPFTLGPNSAFGVAFVYNVFSTSTPGDGLAFVAQNTPSGASYLEMGGSGLGFFSLMPGPAIAATFDFYDNKFTGTAPDTAAIALPTGTDLVTDIPDVSIYGGPGIAGLRYVWVDYSNPTKTMAVYYSTTSTKPTTPILSTVLTQDLSSQFGGQVYFGFTAGTGAFSSRQTILYMHVATTD